MRMTRKGTIPPSERGCVKMAANKTAGKKEGKTKDPQKIQKDYEETVQALKRIDEIWETLTDNEKEMMRIIKRALMQKERKLRERLKEVC